MLTPIRQAALRLRRFTAHHLRTTLGPEPLPTRARLSSLATQPTDDAFGKHLNQSIGKLMASCKRASPADLPRVKRALAHLNAARSLHSLGYTEDARAVVARCFYEIRNGQVAGSATVH